jgi:putative ABC transport system substrate-binding protein
VDFQWGCRSLALELVPGATKIGMLVNVSNQSNAVHRRNVEVATGALALKSVAGEAHGSDDLDVPFETLAREHVQSVLVPPDGLFVSERRRIVTLAAAARLPALYPYREQVGARLPTMHGAREHVEAGGLMSYGPNFADLFRRSADYVDKILRGAWPGELPVEQPTRIDLVVNLTTAKVLGLTVPPTVLAPAPAPCTPCHHNVIPRALSR